VSKYVVAALLAPRMKRRAPRHHPRPRPIAAARPPPPHVTIRGLRQAASATGGDLDKFDLGHSARPSDLGASGRTAAAKEHAHQTSWAPALDPAPDAPADPFDGMLLHEITSSAMVFSRNYARPAVSLAARLRTKRRLIRSRMIEVAEPGQTQRAGAPSGWWRRLRHQARISTSIHTDVGRQPPPSQLVSIHARQLKA